MKPAQLSAIRERASGVPAELRASAHTYGPPCVLIPCHTAEEAEAIAVFVRQAPADIRALLAEEGESVEPMQTVMELV